MRYLCFAALLFLLSHSTHAVPVPFPNGLDTRELNSVEAAAEIARSAATEYLKKRQLSWLTEEVNSLNGAAATEAVKESITEMLDHQILPPPPGTAGNLIPRSPQEANPFSSQLIGEDSVDTVPSQQLKDSTPQKGHAATAPDATYSPPPTQHQQVASDGYVPPQIKDDTLKGSTPPKDSVQQAASDSFVPPQIKDSKPPKDSTPPKDSAQSSPSPIPHQQVASDDYVPPLSGVNSIPPQRIDQEDCDPEESPVPSQQPSPVKGDWLPPLQQPRPDLNGDEYGDGGPQQQPSPVADRILPGETGYPGQAGSIPSNSGSSGLDNPWQVKGQQGSQVEGGDKDGLPPTKGYER
ncbi:hypothetical protein GP486_002317 [Trichoglossum hirsutum]|uniref:Uncharacterized protein n=1 Tax=Trichoglossum hirsutum TaxID=265104 RepID=A0A9P8RRU9_9PEZI|nr:hypothetical protein GP486_002317 [Trichoglossum hirsutum]